ncbi:2-oxoacid:acceptor oxidoreductase family protein [Geosporobacter ferrireducens]|uniref:2-oxoglutarate ferredoxin oxidoreductase subunit gamma n=1 Tax=Geosporobacter ferrireducens TaxID=1424294 RepID=A0A1D8GB35_9FIRM|nr:2-oxoacid:acceptor oxidoreductase family protein [Geosporobacter ferrireducens]AOT68110.1 2-oxoglutarate ferredoxin oxidoreductase subunit gamma [Geosporobacter ferrireducens]AOT73347.1 2-oxoglutarate ferredoxin oxidoreductase subunit gamma [Geosporobacter ferrireducens]MTI54156.1 2-oxoacid:ferredoxin oxidoreductase subunit gamma [Geosporobacter ferrireducens]
MSKQVEIRLTGSGGQGLILGGIIMAEAALLDGKNAIQSQSYGPEARGGASKAEVIISENEIDFPKVEVPDLLLSLTQVAADKYINDIKKDGILLVDSSVRLPEGVQAGKVIQIPILQTAVEVIGKPMVANIIAMGAIQQILNTVSKESLEEAVLSRVPKGTEELNRRALAEGYRLVEKY